MIGYYPFYPFHSLMLNLFINDAHLHPKNTKNSAHKMLLSALSRAPKGKSH
eukprot:c44158_g1_i1 orf=1-150(-)